MRQFFILDEPSQTAVIGETHLERDIQATMRVAAYCHSVDAAPIIIKNSHDKIEPTHSTRKEDVYWESVKAEMCKRISATPFTAYLANESQSHHA